jgi:2-polyprenyl-6-methoxyphenol hydroxylase-like FAD-dependent oxidoreductase
VVLFPHAIVIGAGPAGSIAAMLLARARWNVTLVEQHRFPRDKVCGECLSSVGIDVLKRLELDTVIRAWGAIPLHYTHLHAATGESVTLPLPRPMWGISRHVLDQVLLLEAARMGVQIRQPVRCENLDTSTDKPIVRLRDLATNHVETVSPDWVILADGKSALLEDSPLPTKDFGLKAHFKNVDGPDDAIELFGALGTYGGLAPIEANRWNVAFSVPVELLRAHAGDLEMVFERLVGENKTLRKRLAEAERVSPFMASPLPRFGVRKAWPRGVVPVGNAAAALEPIGGEGMGLAIRSAELAAEYLLRSWRHDEPFDREGLVSEYQRLWRTRRAACRAAAKVVSSGRFAGLAMRLLQRGERTGKFALALMGKSAAGAEVW